MRLSKVAALLLLATLIARSAADDDNDDDHGHGGGGESADSFCKTAECGRGTCTPRAGWIPGTISYKCECDPGWSRAIKAVPFSPCNVPECSFNSSCFDLSKMLPRGIPFSDPCVAVNCGAGECKKDEGFHYHCECEDGHVNMLNSTKFPCIDANCLMGMHCPELHSAPPPRSPPTSPAPPGSVWVQSLLRQLSLVALAVVLQVL
ncbi:hypothetical protein ACP4OV_011070 [Aristida adscensionis]